jgi:hypothetical protein
MPFDKRSFRSGFGKYNQGLRKTNLGKLLLPRFPPFYSLRPLRSLRLNIRVFCIARLERPRPEGLCGQKRDAYTHPSATNEQRRHWCFLFRGQGGVRLDLGGGRQATFAEMVPRAGRSWTQAVRVFKKAGWVECRALGCWKAGAKEPWLLVTNWPKARTGDYGVRMWEEEAFRDLKSNGFNWQRSRVRQPEHANRLWLILALACAWVVSLGTRVGEQPELWCQVARGARERISVFQLGLRWLGRCLHLGVELFYEPHLSQPLLQ